MKILKVLLLLVLTGFVSIYTLQAEGIDKENRYKTDRIKMKELYSKLNLTAIQQQQMYEHRKSIRKYRKERRQNRKALVNGHLSILVEFISKDGFDKKGYMNKKMKIIEKRARDRATMIERRMNILTPNQRVHLVKLLKEQLSLQNRPNNR